MFLADAVHVELHLAPLLAVIDVERLLVDEQLAEVTEQTSTRAFVEFLGARLGQGDFT
jgi:hypothetical protein